MDLGLRDKTALVTGASGGLGLGVAAELAAEGAYVVISSRSEANLAKARASIEAVAKGKVLTIAADTADAAARRNLMERAQEALGRIDILIVNTGGPPSGPFESHSQDRWTQTAESLLGSAVDLCRGVLPGMRQRRWGRIVTVTSVAVKQPVAGLILSNAVRAAVVGFARTLANETAADNVTVNNIMPGFTRTSRIEDLSKQMAAAQSVSPEAIIKGWEADIPMRRLGTVKEFAALVAFLCSERASYITGTSIPVDGGWIKGLL